MIETLVAAGRLFFGDAPRGPLRTNPGPHPTRHKRRFLARRAALLGGFRDALGGTSVLPAAHRGEYVRGWNRGRRLLAACNDPEQYLQLIESVTNAVTRP